MIKSGIFFYLSSLILGLLEPIFFKVIECLYLSKLLFILYYASFCCLSVWFAGDSFGGNGWLLCIFKDEGGKQNLEIGGL